MLYIKGTNIQFALPKETTDYQRAQLDEVLEPRSIKDWQASGFFSIAARCRMLTFRQKASGFKNRMS